MLKLIDIIANSVCGWVGFVAFEVFDIMVLGVGRQSQRHECVCRFFFIDDRTYLSNEEY